MRCKCTDAVCVINAHTMSVSSTLSMSRARTEQKSLQGEDFRTLGIAQAQSVNYSLLFGPSAHSISFSFFRCILPLIVFGKKLGSTNCIFRGYLYGAAFVLQ